MSDAIANGVCKLRVAGKARRRSERDRIIRIDRHGTTLVLLRIERDDGEFVGILIVGQHIDRHITTGGHRRGILRRAERGNIGNSNGN